MECSQLVTTMSRYREPYTLYKRGKYYYYRTYDIRGVRTCGKSTGKTSKGAAKEYCDKLYLLGSLNQSDVTFGEYAEHFFDDNAPYVKDRVKPLAFNSLRIQRVNLRLHLLPELNKIKLCDINYSLLKYIRIKYLEKLSSNTVIGIMGTLQTILTYAYRDRIINHNPFDFLEPIEKEMNLIDAFTLDEIKYLVNNINDEMFSNMILLLALTGMRISEAKGVTQNDIKKGNGFYYIDLKQQLNRGVYTELKGKFARQFPIIPECIELINFQYGRSANFYRAFIPLKKKFETPERKRLTFHSLRHFFITNTIASGIPESKVNYFTGHRQKGINQVYINFKPDDLIEFLDWQRKTYKKITGNSHPTESPVKQK